jgi:SAM-dependent methyltransferase
MTQSVTAISACRLCGSDQLQQFLDFGEVALGNNLLESAEAAARAERYPLDLFRCQSCGHFQLGHSVAKELLYATNYTYLSGVTKSFAQHFEQYAAWLSEYCQLPPSGLVIDVGSNDGTCLKAFKARGYRVCGVDPASMPVAIAIENGVPTVNAFFDAAAVENVKRQHGLADLVTSHNVLAHVEDLGAVFDCVAAVLVEGGTLAFEVGYFREVLNNNLFDTIYHEHIDYHHAKPLVQHLVAKGFDVEHLSVNPIQGGSLRFVCRKTGHGKVSEQASAFLEEEAMSILGDDRRLNAWRRGIDELMANFREALRERIAGGATVAGYGAPTKATLLLKVAGLGAQDISYVVEDNPLKVGRFLPGSAVPILPSAVLAEQPPDVIVVFAWNFVSDILNRLRGTLGRKVEVVVPLPQFRAFDL